MSVSNIETKVMKNSLDSDQAEELLKSTEAFIRQRWRGGRGTDAMNEQLAVATSTMGSVLRQVQKGEIDPNDPDLISIVLDNARRKLDTAQHYYRKDRAKKETNFSKLGADFRAEEIFKESYASASDEHAFVPFVEDEDLESAFDSEQEKKFAREFLRWCDSIESGFDDVTKQVWYFWKLGHSIAQTSEKMKITEYKVQKCRRTIAKRLEH